MFCCSIRTPTFEHAHTDDLLTVFMYRNCFVHCVVRMCACVFVISNTTHSDTRYLTLCSFASSYILLLLLLLTISHLVRFVSFFAIFPYSFAYALVYAVVVVVAVVVVCEQLPTRSVPHSHISCTLSIFAKTPYEIVRTLRFELLCLFF